MFNVKLICKIFDINLNIRIINNKGKKKKETEEIENNNIKLSSFIIKFIYF